MSFAGVVWLIVWCFLLCSWDECRKCCRRSRSRCTRRKRRINGSSAPSSPPAPSHYRGITEHARPGWVCRPRQNTHWNISHMSGSHFRIIITTTNNHKLIFEVKCHPDMLIWIKVHYWHWWFHEGSSEMVLYDKNLYSVLGLLLFPFWLTRYSI